MKRFGLITLVLILLLVSFCGCNSRTTQPDTTTTTTSQTVSTVPYPAWRLRSVTVEADDITYYKGTPNYQFAVIEKDKNFGLIDFEGNLVVPLEYTDIFFRETHACSPDTHLVGEKDDPNDYELPDLWHFKADGTPISAEYDAWGYTDQIDVYWYKGKPVLARENIDPFTVEDYKQWTFPRRGMGTYEAIPPTCVVIQEILSVEKSDDIFPTYSYADTMAIFNTQTQTLVTDFIYEDCSTMGFYDGLAAVKKNGKWGYVREDGTPVTAFVYDAVYGERELASVTNGYIVVRRGDGFGLIDRDGNSIVEPIYEGITEVTDHGLFWIKENGVWQVGELL